MSFTTELERFLCAVKDELDSEVQSMLLFPFDEANMTDATLGYAILQTGLYWWMLQSFISSISNFIAILTHRKTNANHFVFVVNIQFNVWICKENVTDKNFVWLNTCSLPVYRNVYLLTCTVGN